MFFVDLENEPTLGGCRPKIRGFGLWLKWQPKERVSTREPKLASPQFEESVSLHEAKTCEKCSPIGVRGGGVRLFCLFADGGPTEPVRN